MSMIPKSRHLFFVSLLATVLLLGVSIVLDTRASFISPNVVYAQDPDEEPDEDEGQTDSESCESIGGEFSFAVCPVLRLANDGIQLFDAEVRKRVQVDEGFYKENDSGQAPLREIWARIRNIAFMLLIPIVLVLVIGTALGFSIVDAYTVKRAMPRLLFAVIFMTLSYDIGAILIDVSNAASRGVQGMLVTAVGDRDSLSLPALFNPPSVNVPGGGGADIATGALGSGLLLGVSLSVGALSVGILASFLGSAVIGLLLVFFILLARQLIIVAILAILPLAILSWIFPGNDKFWKLSWGTFTALLWAGPAFAGFVVLGRILAYVVNEATAGTQKGGIETVMIIGIKLGLIVMSLAGGLLIITKFAGAAGNILGVANDRAKGLFDRNKNFRTNKRKELGERADSGARFAGKGRIKNFGNRLGRNVRNMPSAYAAAAPLGLPIPTVTAIRRYRGEQAENKTRIAINRAEEAGKDPNAQTLLGNDNLSRVMVEMIQSGVNGDAAVRNSIHSQLGYEGANLNQAVAQVQAFREKYGEKAAELAGIEARAKGGDTDNYDPNTIADIWRQASVAAEDNGTMRAHLAGNMRGWLTSGGRIDSGGAKFGEMNDMMTEMWNEHEATNGNVDVARHSETLRRLSYQNQGAGALSNAQMKDQAFENVVLAMNEELGRAYASGDQRMIQAMLADIANVKDTIAYTNPTKIDQFEDLLNSDRLVPSPMGGPPIVINTHQELERVRNDTNATVFHQRRRELTAQQQVATGGAAAAAGVGPAAGAGGGGGPSDRRLKRDIHYLYTTQQGFRVYRFRYVWSDTEYIGVMAQELLYSKPEAVSTDWLGYYRVNYDLLDIRMLEYKDWLAAQTDTLIIS